MRNRSFRRLLKQAKTLLQNKGIKEPAASSEHLLAAILGVKRTDLWLVPEIPQTTLKKFDRLLRLMIEKRMPLAYILKNQDFMGLPIGLKSRVTFIPRPETELLVETAVREIKKQHNASTVLPLPLDGGGQGGGEIYKSRNYKHGSRLDIADIGTGSGCIALALWTFLKDAYQVRLWASDISKAAIGMARKNAEKLRCPRKSVRWFCGRLLEPLPRTVKLDTVVSNPPYIPERELKNLPQEVSLWEPRRAYLAGPDGLSVIRPLIVQASARLKPGGLLAMEFGYRQADSICKLLEKSGFLNIKFLNDYENRPRVVLAKSSFIG
ncbi:MAG: peptide chain release factor N(5)-glutamine methyltransferase [Elusimicrobia bacterium]|nr:peptide chain release factor N(5)-glutamine methyltransferase [Elusimicrobiota bacterium]